MPAVMVEGGAKQVSEPRCSSAAFRSPRDRQLIEAQEQLVAKAGKTKRFRPRRNATPSSSARSRAMALDRIRAASRRPRRRALQGLDAIDSEVIAAFVTPFREAKRELSTLAEVEVAQSMGRKLASEVKDILHDLRGRAMREDILDGKPRIDGRSTTDIRGITCSVSELSGAHGSALFTRGETRPGDGDAGRKA
jgi:polyribonucleotide nucleotidyltransferase